MKKTFDRPSVRYIDWCLKTVGVNVRQNNIPIFKFYQFGGISPIVVACTVIILYIFKNRKEIHNAVIAAAYIQGTVTMLCSIFVFTRNRHKIFEILTLMDERFYEYPDENHILVDFPELIKEKNTAKISLLIIGYECFGFFLAIISPIFAYISTGVYEATSMYPAWYPWGEDGIAFQIINTCLQFSGCFSGFWIFYVDQILITYVTVEFLRQYKKLNAALSSMQNRTSITVKEIIKRNSASSGQHFKPIFNKVYHENILHCIKHYQQLWKSFRLFEPLFSMFYSIELSTATATLALVFYNLLTAWNPDFLLSVIGSSFNILGNLFSRCIIGEIFDEMNAGTMNTIFYEVDWWELSTDNRNLLKELHKMSTRTYLLKGFSVYTASYETFAKLLRISYSYVNIIRTTLAKK